MTTKIEWTDETWNPVTGCTVKSDGCKNCYAMTLAGTRLKNHPSRAGLTRQNADGKHIWTGEVRFNEAWLTQPLKWKKPRMIFVCAHGDLFHKAVPFSWIDDIISIIDRCPQHTFQILTKRPERMQEYFLSLPQRQSDLACNSSADWIKLPLPNLWLGTSVEDQASADDRIPDLLATPAAVRWLSMEPLLGPIDLLRIAYPSIEYETGIHYLDVLRGGYWAAKQLGIFGRPAQPDEAQGTFTNHSDLEKLDWIVLGGESGTDARPMHPEWARQIRDQCEAAGVPFFFKQWGEWLPCIAMPPKARGWRIVEGVGLANVGKKKAGRQLDGRTHDSFPQVAA